ncbi:MAG: hypothetical protein QF886_05925, partial [Planctomycetota bacterium]|nr:hypothetical protein [Planctomycetota bacterium]
MKFSITATDIDSCVRRTLLDNALVFAANRGIQGHTGRPKLKDAPSYRPASAAEVRELDRK